MRRFWYKTGFLENPGCYKGARLSLAQRRSNLVLSVIEKLVARNEIPAATKANLKMSTSYGEILVDPEFKIDIDRQGEMIRYSDQVSGKINGGGTVIDLSCNYGKVYLRKK